MAQAGSTGVDFGGNSILIGVAKKGGIDVIVNDASNRETPIVVGFGENERFIGEQGYVQLKSNFKNTVTFANRFLGIRADSPFFQEEKKWLYAPTTITQDNRLLFDVTYRGEKRQFTPEQITAMMLQKVKQIIRKDGVQHNDMVLSVPSYYTEQERKALLDAAKIAEVNVVKLMNESTAIALGYGIFRKAELDATPRNVCFVDFGHCKSSAFVASFTKDKVKILNQVHERNLGVRDIDWKLLEFYAKICVEQYESNPIKKEKPRLRLLDAIEKQRKILSANSEAGISVDYIVEDNDLNHTLTREKLEELAVPIVAKFKTLLESLKAEIKVPIHSIEVVGGGTRIPCILKVIQDTFGNEVLRTLNSSECVARGTAIQAAMLNPLFKVAQYGVEEANFYPIRCSWLFKDGSNMEVEGEGKNHPEKQTSILFDRGCSIPNIKSLTFHRDENINIALTYDPAVPGSDNLLAEYVVKANKIAKEKDFGIKVRVTLNKNGIVEFDSASLIEEYVEEVAGGEKMAEEGKPADTQQKPKKTRTTKVTVDLSNFNSLTDKQVQTLFEEEANMANVDRVTHETYEKKNELESYIYDMRNKSGDKYAQYMQPAHKTTLLAELEKVENWLYGEGLKSNKSTYAAKLDELKKLGDPITNRFREYEKVPEHFGDFHNNLGVYESVVTSSDEKFAHITPEERKPVSDAIKEARDWISAQADKLSKAVRHENPPVSSQDVLNKHKAFVDKFYSVINKVKPAPKPEEKKPEEKKAEEKQASPQKEADKGMEEEK